MIWTLYRYILRDLLKLLAMALGVLTVVMSFGFSIKPISDGLLEPVQIVKVIVYTMPGMVTLALPFAAAFASTLVFFRLSQDNEVTACAVSGISYRELLAPVIVLGLILTLSTFWLSNWVVPRFWRLASQEIEQDIASVVIKKIKRREEVVIQRVVVYADYAEDSVTIPGRTFAPGAEPYNTLVLQGVAVGRLNVQKSKTPEGATVETEQLRADHTARLAVVDLFRDDDRSLTYMTMKLSDVTSNDPESGMLIEQGRMSVEPMEIPSPLQQSPKFLSLPDLKRRIEDPELSREVRQEKLDLAGALAAARMTDGIVTALLGEQASTNGNGNGPTNGNGSAAAPPVDPEGFLAASGQVTLFGPAGQRYVLRAPQLRDAHGRLRLRAVGDRKVVVRSIRGDVTIQRFEAEAADLRIADDLADEPRVNLTLSTVTVIDPNRTTPNQKRTLTLPLLRVDRPLADPLRRMAIADLLAEARGSEAKDVERGSRRLRREVQTLERDIESRLHERAAIAVNCLLVFILGAAMSMLLRNQMPLTIFLWCFLPTIAAFFTIFTGQQVLGEITIARPLGIAMTWIGNAALLALNAVVYLKLSRH